LQFPIASDYEVIKGCIRITGRIGAPVKNFRVQRIPKFSKLQNFFRQKFPAGCLLPLYNKKIIFRQGIWRTADWKTSVPEPDRYSKIQFLHPQEYFQVAGHSSETCSCSVKV